MTAIADTYRLVNRWKDAGLSEEQAGKMVAALNEELGEGLVTKADLAEMKNEILRWMVGQTFAIVGLTVALIKLI